MKKNFNKRVIAFYICLCMIFLLTAPAFAEKGSFRGIEYGMTMDQILEKESARGNTLQKSNRGLTPTKPITVAGHTTIDSDNAYCYTVREDSGEIDLEIIFMKELYSTSDQAFYYIASDPILSSRYLHGDYTYYKDTAPKLQRILENLNLIYDDLFKQLTTKYGEPTATYDDNTLSVSSARNFTHLLASCERKKDDEYGRSLLNYAEWLIEYDDCYLAIALYIPLNQYLLGCEYSCELGYTLYSKDNVDTSNGFTKTNQLLYDEL